MDVAATAAKAMARELPGFRLAGTARTSWPTDAEIDRDLGDYERWTIRDEPFPEALAAEGEHQDRVAESGQLDAYDPDDRFDRPDGLSPGREGWL